MKLPLHLDPSDYYWKDTALARLEHRLSMAELNPSGFRTPGKLSRNGFAKRGTTKRDRDYRHDFLVDLCK